MEYKIINTETYLLIVDESEIKKETYCYDSINNILIFYKGSMKNIGFQKVISHLPLNNSPILEGVALLPPIEDNNEVWEQGLEKEINKLPYTKHLDDGQYNDGQLAGFEFGATWGYNKAKEKYKYTEEDLKKAFFSGGNFKNIEEFDYFIKSLQELKMPVGFKSEIINTSNMGVTLSYPLTKTTTTNGLTRWIGEYIY